MQLPRRNLALSLFSFNAGVELGQLVVRRHRLSDDDVSGWVGVAEQGSVGGLVRHRLPVGVLVRSARISMTRKTVWAGGALLLAVGLAPFYSCRRSPGVPPAESFALPPTGPLTIAAGGDTVISRPVARAEKDAGVRRRLSAWCSSATLAITNLEMNLLGGDRARTARGSHGAAVDVRIGARSRGAQVARIRSGRPGEQPCDRLRPGRDDGDQRDSDRVGSHSGRQRTRPRPGASPGPRRRRAAQDRGPGRGDLLVSRVDGDPDARRHQRAARGSTRSDMSPTSPSTRRPTRRCGVRRRRCKAAARPAAINSPCSARTSRRGARRR